MKVSEHNLAWSAIIATIVIFALSLTLDVRSLDLMLLSICSFCGSTGFPDGILFWGLVAFVFVAALKINPFTAAVLAFLIYSAHFVFHQRYFGVGLSYEIIFELPSKIWWFMPINLGEYLLYSVLGKLLQFFVAGSLAHFAFRRPLMKSVHEVTT